MKRVYVVESKRYGKVYGLRKRVFKSKREAEKHARLWARAVPMPDWTVVAYDRLAP